MGKYIRAILLSSLAALLVGCSGGTSTPYTNEITMCGNQSITFDNYYEEHIQLCLNSMEIENYEMCSKQILEHCILNDFKDFRFSYDVNGYPDKIVATIFLAQDDIKENNPIFQVTYSASNLETGEESSTPQYVTQIKKYW